MVGSLESVLAYGEVFTYHANHKPKVSNQKPATLLTTE